MPITKSAKKALRQNIRRKKRNIEKKNKIKSLVRELKKFLAENKNEGAKKLLPQIYKALDKAARIGIIKKNAASRRKSRLTKLVNHKSQTTNHK